MRLLLCLFLFSSAFASIFILAANAQQPVLNRFNQHSFEDRYTGHRDTFLDLKSGTNFYNQYETLQTENGEWPATLGNSGITNYYIWSYIDSSGHFVVTHSVQWWNLPGSLNLVVVDHPLPPGVTPRFPYPHIGTNSVYTVYTTLEDKGNSQLLISRSMNPVPGLDYNKPWYYRLNCYFGENSQEFHTGVALAAGGTRILCINQADLVDGTTHYFHPPGFFNGAYYSGSPVEYMPSNPSHVLANGTAYSAPEIPTLHYIQENYIPGYFQR